MIAAFLLLPFYASSLLIWQNQIVASDVKGLEIWKVDDLDWNISLKEVKIEVQQHQIGQ